MNIDDLLKHIESLGGLANVKMDTIGYSTFGRPIYAFFVGNTTGVQVLMEGGIHAREYLSTLFLLEEIKYLADQYSNGGFDGGFYIVPLVNPDGVALVLDGDISVTCDIQKQILNLINGGNDFSLWKANGLGVDLIVNFDAEWGTGVQNVKCPSSGNFVGFYPESEREVAVLINFAKSISFDCSLSWHTKGEVIYYGFDTLSPQSLARDYAFAKGLSVVNGYQVVKSEGSVGGFSDWVSLNYDVPAVTIELGSASLSHPLGLEILPSVFEKNKKVPLKALGSIQKTT